MSSYQLALYVPRKRRRVATPAEVVALLAPLLIKLRGET